MSRSAGLGVVLSSANPKVIALALGAALALGESGANVLVTAEAVIAFVAIGATGVAVPLAVYLAARADRGSHSLTILRSRSRVGSALVRRLALHSLEQPAEARCSNYFKSLGLRSASRPRNRRLAASNTYSGLLAPPTHIWN